MTSAPAQARMWMPESNPVVYKALVALQRAATKDLDAELVALIFIRASQINGCAYCLHMHTCDAIAAGSDATKLAMTGAWRESTGIFDDRQRAALALTDAVTLIGDDGVPEAVFDAARQVFDAYELGQVLASITMINTWNRVAIAGGYPTSFDERTAK